MSCSCSNLENGFKFANTVAVSNLAMGEKKKNVLGQYTVAILAKTIYELIKPKLESLDYYQKINMYNLPETVVLSIIVSMLGGGKMSKTVSSVVIAQYSPLLMKYIGDMIDTKYTESMGY